MALTQITEKGIKDGEIVNADINTSAAIAGSKISPTFTSNVTISNNDPSILFTDGDANPDFKIRGNGGTLKFIDTTNNNADRMAINSDGHVDVYGNLDVGAGLDVTGTITSTGLAQFNNTINLNHASAGSNIIYFNEDLQFSKNGTGTRIKIDSDGEVGINTTDIRSDLHVCTAGSSEEDGTLRVGGSDSSLGLTCTYDQAGATVSKIHSNPTYNNTSALFHIACGGDTNPNQLVLKGDGKVGINDSAPSYPLNIIGDNAASNGTGMLKGILGIQNDTTAFGSSPTAGISFQTKYRTGPDVPLDLASIWGGKENTTNGDKDGYLGFATREEGGSGTQERMRISSDGYVGIGTTNPGLKLSVQGSDTEDLVFLSSGNNGGDSYVGIRGDNEGGIRIRGGGSYRGGEIELAGGLRNTDPGIIKFGATQGTSFSEKVRITSSGVPALKCGSVANTDIYNTSGTGNEGAWLMAGAASQFAASNSVIMRLNRKTYNGKILAFYYNGSEVGTISTNANSLPSDRNFKTNISDLNLGLSLVKKLKPSQYNYKIDNENTPVMYGLIAQELEESLTSEGITKNSTQLIQHHPTDDSESDYDVDYTKLVPILINSIKELAAKVEALEAA